MTCTDISEVMYCMSSPSYHTQPDQIRNSAGMLTLTVIWQWLMRYQISSVPLSPVFSCWLFRSQWNYNNLYLSEETCFKNCNEEHSCVLLCQHVWPPWGQRKTATIWARSIQQLLSFRLLSWFVIYQNSSSTERKSGFFSEGAIDKLMCSKPTVRWQMADGQIGKLACKIKTLLFQRSYRYQISA